MNTAKKKLKLALFRCEKSLFVYNVAVVVVYDAIEYENAVRINRVFHVSLVSRSKAAFVHNMRSSLSLAQPTRPKLRRFACCKFCTCVRHKSIMHFCFISVEEFCKHFHSQTHRSCLCPVATNFFFLLRLANMFPSALFNKSWF